MIYKLNEHIKTTQTFGKCLFSEIVSHLSKARGTITIIRLRHEYDVLNLHHDSLSFLKVRCLRAPRRP
jgi:hypothetical protein